MSVKLLKLISYLEILVKEYIFIKLLFGTYFFRTVRKTMQKLVFKTQFHNQFHFLRNILIRYIHSESSTEEINTFLSKYFPKEADK